MKSARPSLTAPLNRAAMLYPQRTQEVLWTFLGSHDTQRIRTRAGGDLRMVHAASFFQFTYLGSPIIYYGDELGMEGGEDPDCRRPMRWDDVEDNPTRAHYQKLARLRATQLPRAAHRPVPQPRGSGKRPVRLPARNRYTAAALRRQHGTGTGQRAAGTARGHGGNGGRA